MKRVRLDDELIAQGLCADRDEALRFCMAGLVSGPCVRYSSPATKVEPGVSLHVKGRIPYVGRGGFKLAGALDAFGVDPTGCSCLDIGCSTGGFTDCLLQRGAAHVVSVDVGRAQFDWSLRNDSRVTLLERTNVVDLPSLGYTSSFDLAVCDVSFTSIRTILAAVIDVLHPGATFVTLVKPQFEAAPDDVGEGGIVRDPAVHVRVLHECLDYVSAHGLDPHDICASPITGAKGNREFFLLGTRAVGEVPAARVDDLKRKAENL